MLDVSLLGVPAVRRADRSVVHLGGTQLHLFALLLLHRGRPVARHTIAAALWADDPERHARRLRTALWRLRSGLEGDLVPRGTYLDTDDDGNLAVNDEAVECDVARFEDVVTDLCAMDELGAAGAASLTAAVGHYHGDLLEGSDAPWVATERMRLLHLYLAGLTRLVDWHVERGEYDAAAEHAERVVERDPPREDMHRALIVCHAQRGDHRRAVEQYRRCEQVLRQELGREPRPETRLAVASAHRLPSVAVTQDPRARVEDQPTEDDGTDDPALRFVADLSRAIKELGIPR